MRLSRVRCFVAALALWAACTRPAPAPPRGGTPGAVVEADTVRGGTAPAALRDSTYVEVRGPTLVAFWPANAAAVLDSGGADATALDDFGAYLTAADSGLRALGVRVVNVEGDTLRLVVGDRVTAFAVPPASGNLGYYLVAPGRAPAVYFGVRTDDDLLEAARAYVAAGASPP